MRPLALLTLVTWLLLDVGCRREEPNSARVSASSPADTAARDTLSGGAVREKTQVQIVGVDLRLFENAAVRVRQLKGVAVSKHAGRPVTLDDATSYTIEVESAEMWVGYDDLSVVMNEYTFAIPGAPVRSLRMTREDDPDHLDEIELKGRLKGTFLRFEIEGRPEITPDGRIRIRTTSIQLFDIPVRGLLHALGLEAADLMGHMEERGLTFVGDDMILDASRALPPPRMRGPVTAVRVEADGLRLTFGHPPASPPRSRANYLWFRHGTIKIGRMTQTDAYLLITDADPRDPFDFYGDRMNHQLAAAWSKMSEEGDLTMYVPDFEDIP